MQPLGSDGSHKQDLRSLGMDVWVMEKLVHVFTLLGSTD